MPEARATALATRAQLPHAPSARATPPGTPRSRPIWARCLSRDRGRAAEIDPPDGGKIRGSSAGPPGATVPEASPKIPRRCRTPSRSPARSPPPHRSRCAAHSPKPPVSLSRSPETSKPSAPRNPTAPRPPRRSSCNTPTPTFARWPAVPAPPSGAVGLAAIRPLLDEARPDVRKPAIVAAGLLKEKRLVPKLLELYAAKSFSTEITVALAEVTDPTALDVFRDGRGGRQPFFAIPPGGRSRRSRPKRWRAGRSATAPRRSRARPSPSCSGPAARTIGRSRDRCSRVIRRPSHSPRCEIRRLARRSRGPGT